MRRRLPNRAVRAEKIGQRQHHRELHDFARLKRAEQRHLHPVFRAVVPLAEGQRQNQRADAQHHAQQRQPPKMVHMEDDFAHHQHHRQTQRVKHGLPRASRRRNGVKHHDAHAAEKIRQRHHQRIHRQKARKRQRGQQPQRRNRRAEHDGLHIRRALRFDGAEQQPQHLKHQSQQRDKRHARIARAADGAPSVPGDGGNARLFPLFPAGKLLFRLIAFGRSAFGFFLFFRRFRFDGALFRFDGFIDGGFVLPLVRIDFAAGHAVTSACLSFLSFVRRTRAFSRPLRFDSVSSSPGGSRRA